MKNLAAISAMGCIMLSFAKRTKEPTIQQAIGECTECYENNVKLFHVHVNYNEQNDGDETICCENCKNWIQLECSKDPCMRMDFQQFMAV